MLDLQTGVLRLEGGGENSGGISLAQGAALQFKFRTFEFLEDTDVQGPGLFWVAGGTVQQAGAATRVTMETLRVSGGTLRGSGTYIPMNMRWTGGTLDGAGETIAGSLVIDEAGRKTLSSHELICEGPMTFSGTGSLFILGGATLSHCGTAELVGEPKNVRFESAGRWFNDGTLNVFTNTLFGFGGSAGVLTNADNSIMNIGPGVTTCELKSGTLFRHFGRVNIESGTLLVRGGDSGATGVFNIAGGSELEFRSQLYEVDRTQFTGDGLVRISAATVDFQPGMYAMKNLEQTGGTLTGAGDVTVTNQFDWEGGQMTGTGSTVSTNIMNIDSGGGNLTITQRTLKNEGSQATWLNGDIVLNDGAKFHNAAGAILDVDTLDDFAHTAGADGVVDNDGLLLKLTVGGDLKFPAGVQFNNNHTVRLRIGVIRIAGGGTSTGVFNIGEGSTVDFASDPYLLDAGTRFFGVGAARLLSGRLTVNGEDVVAQTFKMEGSGGSLDGPGRLTITGTFDWIRGGMVGPNIGETRSTGTMNMSGTADKSVSHAGRFRAHGRCGRRGRQRWAPPQAHRRRRPEVPGRRAVQQQPHGASPDRSDSYRRRRHQHRGVQHRRGLDGRFRVRSLSA